MTKKVRIIILTICIVLFFIATPYMVLYSLGYRIDFKHLKLMGTGGIYVKAQPESVAIAIDSARHDKTGVLFTSIFKQNLLPGKHIVTIQKDGYYDYQKTLEVKKNEVTKL